MITTALSVLAAALLDWLPAEPHRRHPPNNPTGARFAMEELPGWHVQLAMRGGWLVVDKACMDATPEYSLAHFCPRPGPIGGIPTRLFSGPSSLRFGLPGSETDWQRLDVVLARAAAPDLAGASA